MSSYAVVQAGAQTVEDYIVNTAVLAALHVPESIRSAFVRARVYSLGGTYEMAQRAVQESA